MLLPDVNVLAYAHRADEKVHRPYREWMEQMIVGAEPFALSVLVAAGFLRIVTNPRIYERPTPLSAALATIEALVERPTCRVIGPGKKHLELLAGLCRATRSSGKLVADAAHAAVAMENGCVLVTRDADFERFAAHGLRWQYLTF